jgi:hypothetical protein
MFRSVVFFLILFFLGISITQAHPYLYDVGVEQIISPDSIHQITTSMTPSALVKNYGDSSASYSVVCSIVTHGVNGILRYADTQTINSLLPDSSFIVIFAQWLPLGCERLIVKMRTIYPQDQNPVNDREIKATSVTIVGLPYRLYYANLHSHSKYSPWDLYNNTTPESLIGHPRYAYAYARDTSGIDILAITDHTHHNLPPIPPNFTGPYYLPEYYDSTKLAAQDATIPGQFVGLAGFEWTSYYGHINCFFTDDFRFSGLLEPVDSIYYWLSQRPYGIGQFNHPAAGNFNNFVYHPIIDSSMELCEMQNIDQSNFYRVALDSGWHAGMTANQDNHVFQIHGGIKWGDGNQLTGIWADSLTPGSIHSSFKHMRTFGTLDRNAFLLFTANDSWMGSVIPNGNIDFHIIATDPDSFDYIDSMQIVTNNGIILYSHSFNNQYYVEWQESYTTTANENRYFFVRAYEHDNDLIQSSAMWTKPQAVIQEPITNSNIPVYPFLLNNYPNPFTSHAIIKYSIPNQCQVKLNVYNSSGVLVRKLKEEVQKQGFYQALWDGCDDKSKMVPKGVYFYRFEADEYTATKKMVMMK